MKKFLVFTAVLFAAAPAFAGYDKNYIGQMGAYEAKYEDTFVHLARDFNLGYVEMRAANQQFDPWIPGAGAKLLIPAMHILPDAPHEGIVINIADMRLYAFVNGSEAPNSYPLGVGREGLETPEGPTTVVRMKHGPVWTPTDRMRKEKPELPPQIEAFAVDNPMGTHALYLGFPLVAIHGTDKPFGIGRRVSSGCLRLYPEGIVDLYGKSKVGMKVMVVNQPVKLAWIGDELYLEAHPDINQAIEMEETGNISSQTMNNEDMTRILKVAGEYQDRLDWALIRTAIRERKGFPIVVARRPSSDGTVASIHEDAASIAAPVLIEKQQHAPGEEPEHAELDEPGTDDAVPAAVIEAPSPSDEDVVEEVTIEKEVKIESKEPEVIEASAKVLDKEKPAKEAQADQAKDQAAKSTLNP
jgi:L,D-transpeptidase ErfK/SrfK